MQLYAGLGGASISFPNRAAAEIDFYAGFRPTFGKLALDLGVWYYWYPKGDCYSAIAVGNNFDCIPKGALGPTSLPNANPIKKDLSFFEAYAKANYTFTDNFSMSGVLYYTPSFLNSGADGTYASVAAKYGWTAFANGVAPYISGEFGRQWLGTSDSFYGVPGFLAGINYKDYNTWNIGVGWTYKVFTVDLRYTDTDLNKGDCNAFTSDFTAGGAGNVTPINPSGIGSNWCGARFVARLSADLTLNTNIK